MLLKQGPRRHRSSVIFARWQHVSRSCSWAVHLRSRLGEVVRGQRRYHSKQRWQSPIGSIVTIALSLTIRPQFAIECLRSSNQRGWVNFGQQLGRKGLTDVSQILTRSERAMGLSYAEEINKSCRYLLPFEHNTRT